MFASASRWPGKATDVLTDNQASGTWPGLNARRRPCLVALQSGCSRWPSPRLSLWGRPQVSTISPYPGGSCTPTVATPCGPNTDAVLVFASAVNPGNGDVAFVNLAEDDVLPFTPPAPSPHWALPPP